MTRGLLLCCLVATRSGCARSTTATPPGHSPFVRLFSSPTEEGFHGLLYVGALFPSLPATALVGHELPPSSMPRPPLHWNR